LQVVIGTLSLASTNIWRKEKAERGEEERDMEEEVTNNNI
jgi:hypothetical protein